MRYYNAGDVARYSSGAHRTVPPRSYSPPFPELRQTVDRLFASSGGNLPMLDRDDVAAIGRLVASTRSALASIGAASPPPLDELERGLRAIVDESDAAYSRMQGRIDSLRRDEEEKAAVAASEDIAVDEKGRMLAREELDRGNPLRSVEPRVASPDDPVTPESIAANNRAVMMDPPSPPPAPAPSAPSAPAAAAVSADDEAAASRSDRPPLTGREAVERRVIPGVPDMPGARARGGLYDTLSAEARRASPPQRDPLPSSLGQSIDLGRYERSDRIMGEAAARNFGRK